MRRSVATTHHTVTRVSMRARADILSLRRQSRASVGSTAFRTKLSQNIEQPSRFRHMAYLWP